MSGVLKLALIGAGRAGRIHATNVAQHPDRVQLVAIADQDRQAAQHLAAKLGLACPAVEPDAVWHLRGVQAVIIAAPTPAHPELVISAARAGLHIFCEKPLAVTLAQAEAMRDAVARAGVVFQLGFMRRFDPDFVRAREALRAGRIGRLMMMRSLGRGPALPPRWAYDPALANGLLAEVNSHDFDSVRWFSGAEVRQVAAFATCRSLPQLEGQVPGFYDNAVVVLELKDGVLAVVEGSCPVHYGYDSRVELLGEYGVLWAGKAWAEGSGWITAEAARPPAYPSWRERYAEAFVAELETFVEAAMGGDRRGADLEDGIRVLEIVLAVRQSLETGQPVTVADRL